MSESFNQTGIDRSVGVLLIGLAVAAFMLLTVLGMNTLRKSAEDSATEPGPADAPAAQVVDFASGT